MDNLKKCFERAELLLETVHQKPSKICGISTNLRGNQYHPVKWKSIHQKLLDLYVEECCREPKRNHLRNASHLLDKLVARDKLSCLLVNLYPGNEGYSVMMKGRSLMDMETVRLPYEEAELLQYIDNEELPPFLVDILECSQVNIFYSGCVIAEVRDYRRSTCSSTYESHHVLLRPTIQTLICDVNALTSDNSRWSHEDKMALESQLILATQGPLCLEPSVIVALVANRQQYAKQAFGVHSIKQMSKKHSQVAINRKWKFERHPAPPHLRLCDFLCRRDGLRVQRPSQKPSKMTVTPWKQKETKLVAPEEVNAMLYAMSLPPPHSSGNHLDFVEEYILESKQGNGKGYYCRLSIHLRTLDEVYIGELYTDRDYVVGVPRGGSCWFEFRTRSEVDRYLHQFIDIFTQESRKTVKISHKVGDEEQVVRTLPGGHAVVFPLTSATSTAMQLGELPSPNSKIAPSVCRRPVSPTTTEVTTTTTTTMSSGSNSAADLASANNSGASERSNALRSTNATGIRRPPSKPTADLTTQVLPATQMRMAMNTSPAIASRVVTVSAAPATISATQPISLGAVPHGGIAVPISLAVVATNQPNLVTASAGVIVGQIPNLVARGPAALSGPMSSSNLPSIVCGNLTTANTIPPPTSVVSSTILPSSVPSVLSVPAGVVSIPVGITGSLSSQNLAARLIASGLKNPAIGTASHLGLIQVPTSHVPTTVGSIFTSGSPSQKPIASKIGISSSAQTLQTVSATPVSAAAAAARPATLMKFGGQPHLQFTLQQSQVASLQLQQLRHKQHENGPSSSVAGTPASGTTPATLPKAKGRKRKASTPPPK